MIKWLFFAVGLLALILAGCASTPPSQYYVLSAGGSGMPAGDRPAVGIAPVEIAGYLDRNRLVTSTSGNRLHIADTQRWGEPLAEGVQRVLRLNLARLLGSSNVQVFPWAEPRPRFVVSVDILRLDVAEGRAWLVAEWRVEQTEEAGMSRRLSEYDASIAQFDAGAGEQVAAFSRLLYRLCVDIADAVGAAAASAD